MRTITVCHVSTLTRWGGVERMLVDFLKHAQDDRLRHIVLSTSSIPEIRNAICERGVPFFQPERRFHYDPTAIIQMSRWLREQSVDIVHSYNAFANSWGHIAAFLANIPVRLTGEHGTARSVQFPMTWFDRWAHRRSERVIANSSASAMTLYLRYGIPEEKIQVIYNAVPPLPDTDVRSLKTHLGKGTRIVGSVGRLDTAKCFPVLVQAATLVLNKRPDVIFVLVGGGPLEDFLRKKVSDLGMEDNFILTGWREDARSLVQTFDIFVSSSIRESFGNVLVEASLAGKPVIAPRIDGIPEAVVDGITGVLLDPTEPVSTHSDQSSPIPKRVLIDGELRSPRSVNPQRMADSILGLLDQPDLCDMFGQAGQRRALELFSIDRYVRDLEATYVEVAKRQEVQ